MKLEDAALCLDCDEVFEGQERCPKCGSAFWRYLALWLKQLEESGER